MDLEHIARTLEESPDYRVLRRLVPRTLFHEMPEPGLCRGIILDTETTGMDLSQDEVIELGMVLFSYDAQTGKVSRVIDTFEAMEQPSKPIPPASTEIHGITDEMVHGKRIDDSQVLAFVRGVDLVIAHNAQFDRNMLEKRLPIFESLRWGCSLKEVPWQQEGLGSAKLDYLLNQFGYFHDAHRAEADCLALLEVLQRPLPKTGRLGLSWVLAAQAEPAIRIWATGSPFDNKDKLKAKGYRFDGVSKTWNLLTTKADLEQALSDLKEAGYNNRAAKVEIEALDGFVRYSQRPGQRETLLI